MRRAEARALAVSTLTALELAGEPAFTAVLDHEPDKRPSDAGAWATVIARSVRLTEGARGAFDLQSEITVTLYVPRPKDGGAAAEDLLDDLCLAAVLALGTAFSPEAVEPQVGPSETGYRVIDGRQHRVERFSVRVDDSYEA